MDSQSRVVKKFGYSPPLDGIWAVATALVIAGCYTIAFTRFGGVLARVLCNRWRPWSAPRPQHDEGLTTASQMAQFPLDAKIVLTMGSSSDVQQGCPACGSLSTGRTRRYVSTGREPFRNLHILECSNCGTGRASPMPVQDRLIDYYSSQYESLEGAALSSGTSAWDLGPARAASQVRLVVKFTKRRGSWLDVGAGYGYLLDAARVAGWSTSGIEPGVSRQAPHQFAWAPALFRPRRGS